MAGSTRDLVIREARRLFAEQGYEATSVADIQAAAGLAPGSGALYKHFVSKRALLEAVLESGAGTEIVPEPLPRDPEQALQLIGRHLLGPATSLTRVDEALAEWLRAEVRAGHLRDHDCDAVAVALVGALAHRRTAAALLDTAPAATSDDERLLAAWVDLALAALDPRRDLLDEVGPTPPPGAAAAAAG
jgi:AcrR family transcriptional regulator